MATGLNPLDDDGAIVGAEKAMPAHLAIGRAVVPGLRLGERRKFDDHHAFDRGALSTSWRP